MTVKIADYTFASGELSLRLSMRGDIEAYPQGAKLLQNLFVDFRGGVVSRPGLEWVGAARGRGRNVAFQLSDEDGGGFILEFTDHQFRVVQEGSYVYEPAKAVTAVFGATLTVPGHGWSIDDWINVEGTDYRIATIVGDDVSVVTQWGIAPNLSGATEAARLFEQATPFPVELLQQLRFAQNGRELVVTHSSIPPYLIIFNGLTDWVVQEPLWSGSGSPPAGLDLNASTSGSAWYVYAVSAVIDGAETAACQAEAVQSAQMSQTAGAYIRATWNQVTDADYYIVYRSREKNREPSLGEELGFVGRVYGTEFVDQNVTPDFKKTPLRYRNPFASRPITKVNVTAEGSGYDYTTQVTISDPTGSGAAASATLTTVTVGTPPTESRGIGSIIMQNGGSGYTNPSVAITGSGSGATAEAVVGEVDVFPLCAARFQQRMVFAGSPAFPQTVYGSRPGDFYNFSYTIPTDSSDAYEHTLDTNNTSPVRFMLQAVSGLMLFTAEAVYEMRGDATGRAITPLRVQASPQMSVGCSEVRPLVIDNDVIFQQARGTSVRSLSYNPVSNMYMVKDLTVLASHLLRHYSIVDWVSAPEPHKQVVCARADGRLLYFVYFPAEKIFAWSWGETCGKVLSLATVFESGRNVIYALVERWINNQRVVYQERFTDRDWHSVQDTFAVDAGLRRVGNIHTSSIRLERLTSGEIAVDTSVSLEAGQLIVADYGRFEVLSQTRARELVPPKSGWSCQGPLEFDNFRVLSKTSVVSGLLHLEGAEVQLLVDGDVHTPKRVVDGAVSLDYPGWEVVVGLGYTCRLETLPIDTMNPVVHSRKRRHFGAALRLFESRGLAVGPSWDKLDVIKERDLGRLSESGNIKTGLANLRLRGRWSSDATVCVEQHNPLPMSVLGLVVDVSFGDDDEA